MVYAFKRRIEVAIGFTLFALTVLVVVLASEPLSFNNSADIATGEALANAQDEQSSTTLKANDIARYNKAFEAQAQGAWQAADELISEVTNPILMGHILAQRYLHRDYTSSKEELANWLEQYGDHPQASRIHQVARRKGVQADTPKMARRNLKGYGESFQNSRHKSPRIVGAWKSGLTYWKTGKFEKAYRMFSSLEERSQTLGDWDRAAISFWAYRAANELGNEENAQKHLEHAARFPRSFYGAQAIHLLGDTLDETVTLRGEKTLDAYLEKIDSTETRNALRRIQALLHTAQNDTARNELLLQYARADVKDRVAFVPLAQQLNLPALQLRMGVDMERKGLTSGKALYPLPQWEPKNGYIVDPALVFAVARQESGFNTKAKSYAGAQGTMQIMPQTAKYIAKKMDIDTAPRLNDPIASINLGQNYLSYLANKPYIKGNVVLLAAAYNAGPGNAKRWSKRLSMTEDPLYFIETLPFKETRDYVMNVMTNYWMYREIMNDGDPGVTWLSEGKWPTTFPTSAEMARAELNWPLKPRS